jgi:hypothetical protein
MGRHARIENDYVTIDTLAWLEQRTGGPIPGLTVALQAWGARARMTDPTLYHWVDIIPGWCAASGYPGPDPTDPQAIQVISHLGSRLDAEVWVARATTPDDGPIAVVLVNDDLPVVYADTAPDAGDWWDGDSVQIFCPNGHGWTWRTGRELLTQDGSSTTVSVVFGPDCPTALDAPFQPCPDCEAHRLGRRPSPCGCDGTWWIVCTTCGARCDVDLPPR